MTLLEHNHGTDVYILWVFMMLRNYTLVAFAVWHSIQGDINIYVFVTNVCCVENSYLYRLFRDVPQTCQQDYPGQGC